MAAQETFPQGVSSLLPWEKSKGPPEYTGICLAGGGVRAAMFSLGVLQVLQEEKQLIFGKECADYLAVVSGGSYIGASYILGGCARRDNPSAYSGGDPLAMDSPEEKHILRNGEYLVKNPIRYALFFLLNLLATLSLFGLLGFIIASLAYFQRRLIASSGDNSWIPDMYVWIRNLNIAWPILIFMLSYWIMVWFYSKGGPRAWLALPCLVVAAISIYPSLEYAEEHLEWDSTKLFWSIIAILLGIMIFAALIVWKLKNRLVGKRAVLVNWLGLWTPRILVVALIVWISIWAYRNITIRLHSLLYSGFTSLDLSSLDFLSLEPLWNNRVETLFSIAIFVSILSILFGGFPSSLHREYRRRLKSCYAVTRGTTDTHVLVTDPLLSTLGPEPEDSDFPRLLICATANVRFRQADGKRTTFAPFILSHDRCGISELPNRSFETQKLELVEVRTGPGSRQREPILSLFTAIACTGAAVSPSMGYKTVPSGRIFITALNIRLGQWLPNPFNKRARELVDCRTTLRPLMASSRIIGDDNEELFTEMLGFYGPRMYISDGGHYDNLGLLALLRARCSLIVCVDSSPEPDGYANELRRIKALACEKMNIRIDINPNVFAPVDNSHLYNATHSIATIHYDDEDCISGTDSSSNEKSTQGKLIVLKLGLTSESDKDLRKRRCTDTGFRVGGGRFPHHKTFVDLSFRQDRAVAYRDVGREVATRALMDPNVSELFRLEMADES